MKRGTCPKCGGNSIYSNKGKTVYYGDRSNICISALNAIRTTIYICSDCRFFEEYVNEDENLGKLQAKWPLMS